MNVTDRPLPDCTQQDRDHAQSIPVLAIIVPTLNEAANIEALPAANGTTMVTGRVGQSCAVAE